VHGLRQRIDELLRPQRRKRAVEAQNDRMLDLVGLDERQLFLQRRDRRRAVGGIEDASRVRLEGDERRRCIRLACRLDGPPDNLGMSAMDSVEAPDG
jgi:hypothetical protein